MIVWIIKKLKPKYAEPQVKIMSKFRGKNKAKGPTNETRNRMTVATQVPITIFSSYIFIVTLFDILLERNLKAYPDSHLSKSSFNV